MNYETISAAYPHAGREELARFAAFVNFSDGCWTWTGQQARTYGRFWFHGKGHIAHRVAYLFATGAFPSEGLHLDHLCRTRLCVRPDHLEAVTPRENYMRGFGVGALCAARTACPKCGGEFSPDERGYRRCEPCRREYLQRYRETPERREYMKQYRETHAKPADPNRRCARCSASFASQKFRRYCSATCSREAHRENVRQWGLAHPKSARRRASRT